MCDSKTAQQNSTTHLHQVISELQRQHRQQVIHTHCWPCKCCKHKQTPGLKYTRPGNAGRSPTTTLRHQHTVLLHCCRTAAGPVTGTACLHGSIKHQHNSQGMLEEGDMHCIRQNKHKPGLHSETNINNVHHIAAASTDTGRAD